MMECVEIIDWMDARARALEHRRQYREAAELLEHLLGRLTRISRTQSIDVAQLAAIHYRLGMAHRALKDNSKSIYHLKFSTRLNSSEPKYFQAFGRAYLTSGHWTVAKAQFERAIALQPKNSVYLRQYAWVLMMMGQREDAVFYAERAFRLNPRSRESAFHLVRMYLEAERVSQAYAVLLRLKKADPQHSKTRALIQMCQQKLELRFEGLVLRCLRKGMKGDAAPFLLSELREAENFWMEFCALHLFEGEEAIAPHIWAAAVCWYQSYKEMDATKLSAEDIWERFSVSSMDVWPCIRRIQETLSRRAKAI